MVERETSTTPATVRERLVAAGIAPERVDAHLAAAVVRVDGEYITDPAHPLPKRPPHG